MNENTPIRGWINQMKPFLIKGKLKEFIERKDLNETFKRSDLDDFTEYEKICICNFLIFEEDSKGEQEIISFFKENIEWYKNLRYTVSEKNIKRSEIKSKEELEMYMMIHHKYTTKINDEYPFLEKNEKGDIISCEDYIDGHYLIWKKDYDNFGNEIYYEDSNGNVKYFEYDSNNKVINTITNLIDAKRKFISYKRNILKNEVINYITKNPPTKNKSYYGYVGSLGEYWVHENFYEIKIKDITKNDIFYENINNLGYIYIYDIDGNIVYKNSPKNEKIIEKKEEVLNN